MTTFRRSPMRISASITAHLSRIARRQSAAERVAITGLKVAQPSDAPGLWGEIRGIAAHRDDQAVFHTNAERAQSMLDSADQTLGMAAEVMKRAWELGVQMSSETYDAASRDAASKEMDHLHSRMLDLANTRLGDRYLFSGEAYDTQPFDTATGAYTGSTNPTETRVGRDTWATVGWDGSAVFQGTHDAFQLLQDLTDALAANDPDAVQSMLGDVHDTLDQVLSSQELIGFEQQQARDAVNVAESMDVLLNDRLQAVAAEDPVKAYTELAELRTSYEAALQVSARSFGPKLFDFLG